MCVWFFFLKELKNVLPCMLESIFGYGQGPGWGLDSISRASTPQDFDSVRRLLAPEGPVLSLVYSLMADSLYEFPINSIPVSIVIQKRNSIFIYFINLM